MTTQSEIDAYPAAKFKPNSPKQWDAIGSRADITIFGGARGGGKTMAALMWAAMNVSCPGFTAAILRKDSTQVRQPGGLWDTALTIYPELGGDPNESHLWFKFPSGAKVCFGGLQYDSDLARWKGSQIAFLGFDQLEEFTRRQFFELQACNRSTSGVSARTFATCNPNPDSFLRSFLAWWIDGDGYAIESRSGVLRYFTMQDDQEVWAESLDHEGARAELAERVGAKYGCQSVTFIPAKVEDNVDLMRTDPTYRNKLAGGRRVDRDRFLLGNWNTREAAGDYFRRDQFPIVDAVPPLCDEWRYWDRAATVGSRSWTVGVRMGRDDKGRFFVTDCIRFQAIPQDVEQRIVNVTHQDGCSVNVGIEGDPGQAGKSEAQSYVKALAGYRVVVNRVHESKGARARPLSSQVAIGNVYLVRAPWNDEFLRELENFNGSDKCQADQVDASSGAFHMLTAVEPQPTISFVDF